MEEDFEEEYYGEEVGELDNVTHILEYYKSFPEVVRDEAKDVVRLVTHPSILLGWAYKSDIASIQNKFELYRLNFKALPSGFLGDGIIEYDLLTDIIGIILRVSEDGKLLQALTGYRVPPEQPARLLNEEEAVQEAVEEEMTRGL